MIRVSHKRLKPEQEYDGSHLVLLPLGLETFPRIIEPLVVARGFFVAQKLARKGVDILLSVCYNQSNLIVTN
jgi:hypothetical protein